MTSSPHAAGKLSVTGTMEERNSRQRDWGTFSRLVVIEQEETVPTAALKWGHEVY